MEKLIQKENNIFQILQQFIDENLEFIIVGGYAVSSFKHRFSVDADIVIQNKDLEQFETTLKKRGFKQTINRELKDIYSSRFIRYEKEGACIDLMVDALASRQTNGSFSYDLLLKNSSKRKIIGIEKEITAIVPSKEMLIATKIHSGRLTDFRDVAALANGADLNTIKKLAFIGDINRLNKNLKELNKAVNDKRFIDSFKGVFIEKKFDIDFGKVRKISEMKKW